MQNTIKGGALFILLALCITACSLFNQNKAITTMTGDYSAEWKIVDSLTQQQLPKSALEKIAAIAQRARSENNVEQMVKAVLHESYLVESFEEDGPFKAVAILETAEKSLEQPAKAIIQSVLANKYANYLRENGWSLSERTPIPDGEGGDIGTWSAAQLERKTIDLYLLSTTPTDVLGNMPIGNYKALINMGNGDTLDQKLLRPTLLDVLTQRAIEHLRNETSYINEPAYAFVLDQEAAFAQPEDFGAFTFESKDPYSGKWRTLILFQKLTQWHIQQGNQQALLSLTLERLHFALDNSTKDNRQSLYNNALAALLERYKTSEGSTEIMYKQATAFRSEAKPGAEASQNLKKVVEICKKAIEAFPYSYGAKQCKYLLNEINLPKLQITIERTNIPNQPLLANITYKNVSKGYYKIVQIPEDPGRNYSDNLDMANWLKGTAVASDSFTLKDFGDYEQHSTEIMIKPLPVGSYMLLLSDQPTIEKSSDLSDHATFQSTNLATIALRDNQTMAMNLWLMNRNSGQPIPNVQAKVVKNKWENGVSKDYVIRELITDANGKITVQGNENTNLSVVYTQGPDVFKTHNLYNFSQYTNEGAPQVEFFTDRTLYRPGQMVYFKGIILRKDAKNKPSIVPNTSVNIALSDPNGQQRGTLQLTSNEFGTFNGVFTLPTGALTGYFSLSVLEGATGYFGISVEEYKRPRFEVNFEPLEGSFRINESVTVKGSAVNYAGNPTDGATVQWRVVRHNWVPSWWYRCGGGYFSDPSQEVATGTATTDADGKFDIVFKAIPNNQPEDKYPPAFDYEISADITDISGETRSNVTQVKIGKNAFVMGNELATKTILDSLKSVTIFTNNLASQKVPAKGTVTVQKLDAPNRFFKERLFQKPEFNTLDEQTFRQNFPDFAWNGEDQPENWKPIGQPTVFNFDTEKSTVMNVSAAANTPGQYKITMEAKDNFGSTIRNEKIVEVRKNNLDFNAPEAFVAKSILQPGEKAVVGIGTTIPNFNALVTFQRQYEASNSTWNTINGSQQLSLDILENDRGGAHIAWIGIYNNRVYAGNHNFDVPYSNKQLDITFETFRDKLQPGSKEEWRLRISGPNKEKVAAEIAASMYDASLDQYMPFNWGFSPYYNASFETPYPHGMGAIAGQQYIYRAITVGYPIRVFPSLNYTESGGMVMLRGGRGAMRAYSINSGPDVGSMPMPTSAPMQKEMDMGLDIKFEAAEEVVGQIIRSDMMAPPPPPAPPTAPPAPIRRNLQETVFFYPELRTDANGDLILKFTMNEALTRWKLQLMAHTKDLKYAIAEKSVVTQKDLMITANAPRFFRAGDQLEFAAKVSNLTDMATSGTASLALMDAVTLQPLEQVLGLTTPTVNFDIASKQSTAIRWSITIPTDYTGAVTWRVFADSKAGRDGEENTVPVVTNRQLVTETLPMSLRGNQEKTFRFEALPNSSTRTNHSYTLEFTSNPAWYAVQSLPYLMEYPHECSEQMFSRFYANTLASNITEKLPAIRRVYERWKGTPAMASNLSKNQELKNALLEETPWVLEAQQEAQQKQQIALLFDMNRMADERNRALTTLLERQQETGGWPWFPGGQESWSITQHIMCGMAHLERLNAFKPLEDPNGAVIVERGFNYCNEQAQKAYNELEQRVAKKEAKWDDDHLNDLIIQYLYLRSFYPDMEQKIAHSYYKGLIGKYWKGKNLYQQGLLALIAHRNGEKAIADQIIQSLRERAIVKDELGMYWANDWGFYWYQLPIETQAIMVEVFNEVANDRTAVDNLRIWMLKNKQTNRWESTKATSEAIYALLLTGDNWLNETKQVQVQLGGQKIVPQEVEAGSGYFKQTWTGSEIKPSWSEISVNNPNSVVVWGAAYRQYFEDLDKVTGFKKTGLTLVRGIYLEKNSDNGPVLSLLKDGDKVKVGDKLKVRVEIRSDRQMEFVHLKDMRPSGCEPVNVLSGYRYHGGLGYYESTRDLATHFFIDYLPRGTFVLEYPLVATHKGNMSFGIAALQSMYAPEFTSHSSGIKIIVE